MRAADEQRAAVVFVPFLGDFLSMAILVPLDGAKEFGFRPLSWGLSFNYFEYWVHY